MGALGAMAGRNDGRGASGSAIGALVRRVEQIRDNVEYRRMVEPEDRAAVYRLRYEGYLREGKIAADASRMLRDEYDDLPNTDSYGIFVCGRLVSTVRLSILTPQCPHSPSVTAFGDDVLDRVKAGRVIVDPQRLVIEPRAVGQFPELPWLAVRIPTMAVIHYGADECLSSVQVHHKSFYERIFRTTRVGGPVHYAPLDMTIETHKADAHDLIHDLNTRYPFLCSDWLERRQLFGRADRIPGLIDPDRWQTYDLAA